MLVNYNCKRISRKFPRLFVTNFIFQTRTEEEEEKSLLTIKTLKYITKERLTFDNLCNEIGPSLLYVLGVPIKNVGFFQI